MIQKPYNHYTEPGFRDCWALCLHSGDGFPQTIGEDVPDWVTWICAITMAAGTAAGGRRIIKTMGTKLVRMSPINGFAAQSVAALVIQAASHWGIPLSTTHVISSSIMGVGATKRFSAVKWGVAGNMVWAWVLTIPVTAFLAFYIMKLTSWIMLSASAGPPRAPSFHLMPHLLKNLYFVQLGFSKKQAVKRPRMGNL